MDYKKKLAKRCEQLGFTLTVDVNYYDKNCGDICVESSDAHNILATEIKIPKSSDVEIDDLTFSWGPPDDPLHEGGYDDGWSYDDGTNLQITCWQILEQFESWVVTHDLDKLMEEEKNECN